MVLWRMNWPEAFGVVSKKEGFGVGLLNMIDHLYTREIGRDQECFPEELLRLQVEWRICSY